MRCFRKVLVYFFLLTCFLKSVAWADSPQFTEDNLQLWTPVNLTLNPVEKRSGKLAEKLFITLEAHPRWGDNLERRIQFQLQPGIGIHLTPHWSASTGYGWINNFQSNRWEHRVWQQLSHEQQWKRLTVQNRVRLEERFFENNSETGVRGRYQLRLIHPLGKSPTWYVVGFNELFVGLNNVNEGPQAGYNQNRSFLGIGRKLSEHVRMEAGYQLQHINRRDPLPNRANHVLLMTVSLNL